MFDDIKRRANLLKDVFTIRASAMGYFYGEEATDIIKKAYGLGALHALDEILYYMRKREREIPGYMGEDC